MDTHHITFRVWLGHWIQFFWKACPYCIFQGQWIHVGRLVSFEVASIDLPTVLKEDRIASFSYFSKAWLHIWAQLAQRILYKRQYSLDRPAYRRYRAVPYLLSTNFASKTSIASSKDNLVDTAMLLPLLMEQLEYGPSINQLLLEFHTD